MRGLILGLALLVASPALAAPFDGKVDIGGRHLRIACQGTAAPTVIVETGMGMAATTNPAWQGIAGRIAATARICRYDRAGLGGSDQPPQSSRTSDDTVADLDRALVKAEIPGPYVFAAHSIGGLHALNFARLHPDKVAGIVLISSTHPDQDRRWLAALPAGVAGEAQVIAETRRFLATRGTDPSLSPERLLIGKSSDQARGLRTLGTRPLVVVTHSPSWKMVPDMPDAILIPLENETQRMQKDFLRLSTRSVQRISATGDHFLPEEDPALIEAGILEAITMVRRR